MKTTTPTTTSAKKSHAGNHSHSNSVTTKVITNHQSQQSYTTPHSTTATLKNIAVFCGSNYGEDPRYYQLTISLGQYLGQTNRNVIYGGSKIGLMGAIAESTLEAGGEVYGVIPKFLQDKEVAAEGLTKLVITSDMHTRKLKMMDMADAFIILPGGIGTLEELFDCLSASQLKTARKPIGILNINGFYNHLIELITYMAHQGFLPIENMTLLCISEDPIDLMHQMEHWQPRDGVKWITPSWAKQSNQAFGCH